MSEFNLMLQLSHYSAYVAALSAMVVACGFVQLALSRNDLIGHLAKGLLLIHSMVFLRIVYWDVVRFIVPADAWDRWYELSSETAINLVFNGLVILAGYYSLRSLHMSIPDRENYTLLGAIFYPRRPRFLSRPRR